MADRENLVAIPFAPLERLRGPVVPVEFATPVFVVKFSPHACTDITGFALLGHGYEMAEKSGVRLRFNVAKLPFLEGAVQYAGLGLFPGGTENNRRAYEHAVRFAAGIPVEIQQLLYTPETSGGLLISLAPREAELLLDSLQKAGVENAAITGEVVSEPSGVVTVT